MLHNILSVKRGHKVITILMLFCYALTSQAQHKEAFRNYQQNQVLTPFSIPLPTEAPTYTDLDGDGDPDILESVISGTKILWIDDDDDMTYSDLAGDTDSDCVMIDVNNDGKYGSEMDLIVDWIDEDSDGTADIQAIVDNGKLNNKGKWASHFIWFFDDDHDGVFSYVNWDHFKFEGWDRTGQANFFADYNGKSKMIKVHITTWNIENLEYNWENPFLYYDPDGDGLTEMAVRVVDEPNPYTSDTEDLLSWQYSKKASLIQMTWDMDNDTRPSNEQDFDMSLKFMGPGFDYSDQIHNYSNLGGLRDADYLFDDPRWRHMDKLIYPDHDQVVDLTFNRGEWDQCWFIFDEDDDCHRWERVDFYDPKSPFKIGAKNGGLDHHPQADVAGDRGEWDIDFSGKGQLYISPLDCRIHLLGAEHGYWRIDQNATYYQGWQGWRGPNLQPEDFVRTEPTKYGTVKYEDMDNNGFMDKVSFDMDGDQAYEEVVSLIELGIKDEAKIFVTSEMNYSDMRALYDMMADEMWRNAMEGKAVARAHGVNTDWYAIYAQQRSQREKYNNGFWLSYYIYRDMMAKAKYENNSKLQKEIQKAYFSSDWTLMKN